ncbi:MAG TPA: ATP-binding protein [Candidatus Saccharimonadales bacterium]|nr:ATP-binding protein [Candidatus Saccharimonadales bacterium]
MLNAYIAISAVLALVFIILGLLAATRNIQSSVNRLFLIFSILIAGWLVTNYLGGEPSYSHAFSLVANRLIFFFGLLTVTSLLFFMKSLIGRKGNIYWTLALYANLLFAVFGLATPLIVSNVRLQNDTYAITFGTLSLVYFIILILDFLALVAISLKGRRTSHGQLRSQINIILISLAITLGGVIATNGLVPFIAGYYGLSNAGAFLTFILVSGIAYSMVKHRLFDIKFFVVRAVAYLVTILTLAAIFAAPSVLFTSYLINAPLPGRALWLLTALTILIAVLYQPLRTYFNRVTNKLFYRDYYEPQEVLNRLTNVLVGSLNLQFIKDKTSAVLMEALRPDYIRFLMSAESDEQTAELLSALRLAKKEIIIADELSQPDKSKLYKAMDKEKIAIAVKLRTTREDLGFILLGYKQSGSFYSKSDQQVLGIASDSIAIALQNALRFREIQKFNLTLTAKVEAATAELKKANQRLKALDQTKDEFISMASHQLRTPLTTIKGYLSMVLEGDAGPVKDSQRAMLEQAFNSSSRMVYLIADLLNVSRLQSGKFVITNKPTDLSKVVEGEIAQLKDQAANRQVSLTYQKPENWPQMNLDEDKIRQVVMNFLDNALYYTPAGGSVTAQLSASPKEVTYTVTDTGVGVPKNVQHHLFSKFYRAENARKMRPDGTGLGLYMAKKVITAQGGAIIFKSTEGQGSTFGFSLPRDSLELK